MLCNVGPKIIYSDHGLLSTVGYKLGKNKVKLQMLIDYEFLICMKGSFMFR